MLLVERQINFELQLDLKHTEHLQTVLMCRVWHHLQIEPIACSEICTAQSHAHIQLLRLQGPAAQPHSQHQASS